DDPLIRLDRHNLAAVMPQVLYRRAQEASAGLAEQVEDRLDQPARIGREAVAGQQQPALEVAGKGGFHLDDLRPAERARGNSEILAQPLREQFALAGGRRLVDIEIAGVADEIPVKSVAERGTIQAEAVVMQ